MEKNKEKKKSKLLRTLSFISILLGYISIGSFTLYGVKLIQNGNTGFGAVTIICCIVFLVIHTALLFIKDDADEKKRKKKAYKKVFKYVKTGLKIAVLAVSVLAAAKTGIGNENPMDVLLLVWLVFTVVVDLIISINIYFLKKTVGKIKGKFTKKKGEE